MDKITTFVGGKNMLTRVLIVNKVMNVDFEKARDLIEGRF